MPQKNIYLLTSTMTMCIVINMNIYITKANEELLNKVRGKQSMSGLINKLLDAYRIGQGADLFPPGATNLKVNKGGTIKAQAPKVCKIHGLPLDARGRCLQKGCKYA